jgi:hypothetical protein
MTPEAKADQETQTRLRISRVLHYANTVERGHETWADLMRPTVQELSIVADYLRENPLAFGQQYLKTIEKTLQDLRAQSVVMSQTLRAKMAQQDFSQNVTIEQLATSHK